MKAVLRLELPRLESLGPGTPLAFALVEQGRVSRSGELPMAAIAATLPIVAVVAVLHPADATVADAMLPPLPAHRLAAALAGVVEPLVLGDVDTLALASGPRQASGQSPVAWADRAQLARAWQLLAEAGLPVEALVPAPLALPLPPADGITLALQDGHLLCRSGLDAGQVLPLDPVGPQDATDPSVQAWLRLLWQRHPEATATWVDAAPAGWRDAFAGEPPAAHVLPASTRWNAPLPAWSLAVPALRPTRLQRSPWRRPIAWVVAAAAVWTVGLNVHAMRLEGEAAELRQRMGDSVRAAFPQLPVILDPLRQATQQRDALRAAAGSVAETDFLPLALAASQLLPLSAGNVATVAFADETLSLRLVENPPGVAGALDPGLARRAQELGLQVDQRDGAWVLQRQQDGETTSPGGMTIRPGGTTQQRLSERAAGGRP